MEFQKFKELLKKYRAGTANREEIDLVNRWYDQFGNDFPELERDEEKKLRNHIYNGIQTQLHENQVDENLPLVVAERAVNKRLRTYMLIAAVAIGSLLALGSLWMLRDSPVHLPAESTLMVVETQAGQIKKIILPDSSALWLNHGSKLSISKQFDSQPIRQVNLLYGEVHFKVKSNPEKPFVVSSSHMKTQVLGTSFTIKSYRELPFERIVVASGRVQVSGLKGQNMQTLTPGEQLEINKETGKASLNQVEPSSISSWTEGTSYLNQVSFGELALELKNKFGIDLLAGDAAISEQKYTLTIDQNLVVDELLEVICLMHNNQIRKEDDRVIIY
ncbi:MAG: FecR family protein [Sphingobacterium sp.]